MVENIYISKQQQLNFNKYIFIQKLWLFYKFRGHESQFEFFMFQIIGKIIKIGVFFILIYLRKLQYFQQFLCQNMVLLTLIYATCGNISGDQHTRKDTHQEPWNGNLSSLLTQLSQPHMQLVVYQMFLSVFIYYMFSNQLSTKIFFFFIGLLKQSISILTLSN